MRTIIVLLILSLAPSLAWAQSRDRDHDDFLMALEEIMMGVNEIGLIGADHRYQVLYPKMPGWDGGIKLTIILQPDAGQGTLLSLSSYEVWARNRQQAVRLTLPRYTQLLVEFSCGQLADPRWNRLLGSYGQVHIMGTQRSC